MSAGFYGWHGSYRRGSGEDEKNRRKLIGMAAPLCFSWLPLSVLLFMQRSVFQVNMNWLLDTAYILSDAEADEITGLLDELSELPEDGCNDRYRK